jgi:hypothetical protein
MKLTCQLGVYGQKIVEVNPREKLSVLLGLLGLSDKNSKFIFRARTYTIYTNQTFQEIGLTSDTTLFIVNQAIAGFFKE